MRDTYRQALGLPTDLETAQRRARAEAEDVPGDDADVQRMAGDDPALAGTSIQFGDGAPIPLGPKRARSMAEA